MIATASSGVVGPELKAAIRTRADEIERARRIPADLVRELTDAGCFRLLSPRSSSPHDYTAALALVESLAEADASVAWVVSQSSLGQAILGYLPPAAHAEIYAQGPDVCVAGVFAPKGRASHAAEGWSISGQWAFASGCELASWIYLQCLVHEGRHVVTNAANEPVTRLAVLPASAVEILDTWDAVGLRGTGSHDVRVRARICRDEWTCPLGELDGTGERLQAVPLIDHAGLFVAAVAVGAATGAVHDAAELAARGKRPAFSPVRLADDPVFRQQLGDAHMRVRAARALLRHQAALVEAAMGKAPLSALDRATLRATCHHVTRLAVDAVDVAYTIARSSSVFAASPLQRRFRDAHTITQHAWSSADFSQHVGAAAIAAVQA